MNPADQQTLETLHKFYAASVEPDLDAAWADGQRRATRGLQNKIDDINRLTRADYEQHFNITRIEELA